MSVFLQILIPSLSSGDEAYYLYDDTGRLRAVIDSQSNEIIYNYDEVGNLISVTKRTVTGTIAITDFDPQKGSEATEVIIYGKGFSTTPSNNTVEFNGVAAPVTSSTTTTINTSVPSGTATGKITVANTNGTATSADDFIIPEPITEITVSPEIVFLFVGGTKQFTAYADGVETNEVRWSVEGIEGGNYTYGIITDSGLYTAISNTTSIEEITVTATSLIAPAISGDAKVLNPPILSAPVSVGWSVVLSGTVASRPVSIGWPAVLSGTVASRPVSIGWSAVLSGTVVSAPVSVEIGSN